MHIILFLAMAALLFFGTLISYLMFGAYFLQFGLYFAISGLYCIFMVGGLFLLKYKVGIRFFKHSHRCF
jgi:hypothetical protein